jgi:hypothetical protein
MDWFCANKKGKIAKRKPISIFLVLQKLFNDLQEYKALVEIFLMYNIFH